MNSDGDNKEADLIVIKALRAEFGSDALRIANQMLAGAAPEARAGWKEIVAKLERDGSSDHAPPAG